MKSHNFSSTSKTMPNKDIIATIENTVKDLEKEDTDTVRSQISLTVQNSKSPKDNFATTERKAFTELKSVKLIVLLPVDKGRYTVILNREDYFER